MMAYVLISDLLDVNKSAVCIIETVTTGMYCILTSLARNSSLTSCLANWHKRQLPTFWPLIFCISTKIFRALPTNKIIEPCITVVKAKIIKRIPWINHTCDFSKWVHLYKCNKIFLCHIYHSPKTRSSTQQPQFIKQVIKNRKLNDQLWPGPVHHSPSVIAQRTLLV